MRELKGRTANSTTATSGGPPRIANVHGLRDGPRKVLGVRTGDPRCVAGPASQLAQDIVRRCLLIYTVLELIEPMEQHDLCMWRWKGPVGRGLSSRGEQREPNNQGAGD